MIDYVCRVGIRSIVQFRVRPAAPDPNDEMVFEAASTSDWIVTHNLRDIAIAAARFGIDVITPAEAVRRLGESP